MTDTIPEAVVEAMAKEFEGVAAQYSVPPDSIADMKRALKAAEQAGWKLVPVEATEEMTHLGQTNGEDAFNEAQPDKNPWRGCGCPECDAASHRVFGAVYRAMIAASPKVG